MAFFSPLASFYPFFSALHTDFVGSFMQRSHKNLYIQTHYDIPKNIQHFEKPVIFLVNNTSYLHTWLSLAPLQTQSYVNVIWEQLGTFHIPIQQRHIYPEDIEVHIASHYVEEIPTITKLEPITEEELVILDKIVAGVHKQVQPQATKIFVQKPEHPLETLPQKLLGLCKIWIAAKYFFYDEAKTGEEWDKRLQESMQNLYANDSCMEEYRLTVSQLLVHLSDSHCLLSPMKNRTLYQDGIYGYFPIKLRYIEKELTIAQTNTSLLRLGDIVTHINGLSTTKLIDYWRRYIPASTEQAFYRDFCFYLSIGKKQEQAKLTIKGDHSIVTLEYSENMPIKKQQQITEKSTDAYIEELDGNLVYLKLCDIPSQEMYHKAVDAIANFSGIILELRSYSAVSPNPLISALSCRPVHSCDFKIPIASHQSPKSWLLLQYIIEPDQKLTQPVVALIDETTQSATENICIYLRHSGRVTFMGSPTAGCHGNACHINLAKNESVHISTMKISDDYGKFQNIGIQPDITVIPTIEGIRANRDEVLEQAIQFLREENHV